MDRVDQLCLGCRGERGTGDTKTTRRTAGGVVDAGEEMMVCLLKSSQIYQRCSDFSCLCFLVLWIDSFCSSPAPLLPSLSPVLFLCLVSSLSLSIVHLGMHPSSRLSLLGLVINADCLSPIEQQSCSRLTDNTVSTLIAIKITFFDKVHCCCVCQSSQVVAIPIACLSNLHAALPQPQPQRIPERSELRTPKIKALK